MLFLPWLFFSIAILTLMTLTILSVNSFFISMNFIILSILSMNLNISLIMDWTSLLFSFSVLFISSMVIMYSYSYIPIKEHKQYSIILSCFISAMILLIFSNNIFFLMLGWDGLGLTSYILVIFYQNHKSKESGALTILSNRMGDIFIILSISTLMLSGVWEFSRSSEFPYSILILLILAASSKSAQFPFSAWLPAAMAAPTPISALVHSSTLVTAGTFLLIRTFNTSHPSSSIIILFSSLITLWISGLSANWEQDLKKIIALSTLSQIAFMMLAISINSPNAAFFHLITHAFFKSTMFLCAGFLIHNSSYQDFRFLNSSSNFPSSIFISMGICSMALLGTPFLSGFFSKDSIMEKILSSSLNLFIFLLTTFSIGLTASYSSRLSLFSLRSSVLLKKDTFIHSETPMILPIMLLSPLSIIIGSSLMWLTLPTQHYMMPMLMKLSISTFITLGLLTGMSLHFKSKKFNALGESSISIWFIHFISCTPFLNLMKKGKHIHSLDHSWIEMMSAQGSFNLIKSLSSHPQHLLKINFLMLSLLFISPIIVTSSSSSLFSALYWS